MRHVFPFIFRFWTGFSVIFRCFFGLSIRLCHMQYHRWILMLDLKLRWFLEASYCITWIKLMIEMILVKFRLRCLYRRMLFHWSAVVLSVLSESFILAWLSIKRCISVSYYELACCGIHYWRLQSCLWILLRRHSLSFRFDECFSIIWVWYFSWYILIDHWNDVWILD